MHINATASISKQYSAEKDNWWKKRSEKGKRQKNSLILICLSCAGITFCFFVGFPFANHNESYEWITYFEKVNLWHASIHQFSPVATFRPLGIATAWAAYYFTGNVFLQQVLNYLFVIASLIVLYSASPNKLAFSIFCFLNGSLFFSGYVFLFHLHGVFYGPFQLYLAYLIKIASEEKQLSTKLLYRLFAFTLAISLYHTFSLMVFAFFILGFLKQDLKTPGLIASVAVIISCVILSKLLSPGVKIWPSIQMVQGFVASFKMVEIGWPQSTAAGLLCLLVSLRLTQEFRTLLAHGLIIGTLASTLFSLGIPILLLWVGLSLLETYKKKNWPLFFLLCSTLLIPALSSTGSPTYSVFVLLICTFITAGSAKSMPQPDDCRWIAFSTVLLLICALILIRLDIRVPILSKMVGPILAEKEKTFQLENVISWAATSKDFKNYKLQFFEDAGSPVYAKNSINRMHRPPTTQNYLDFYRNSFYKDSGTREILYITFGQQKIERKKIVYQVKGRYNGNAYVYQ